ncbi:hypothetical protein BRC97_09000 [Halobacteriales archaeon QS_6_71_20]|nr:MAG: hypothetical protein BRC97_09000 [Halobacteriales archaeon QS_6_71_20]
MWGGREFGKPMAGRVVGGDWDRDVQRLEDYDLYGMLRAHFEDGVPWESTAHYRSLLERVRAGETVWHRCSSRADIDARCAGLDDLYRRIDRDGVLAPRAVESSGSGDPLSDDLLNRFPVDLGAISVDVGRDGDPILDDGRHRLIVAKLCDVAEIPVTVLVRHRQWQAKRNEWANGRESFDHFDRPL